MPESLMPSPTVRMAFSMRAQKYAATPRTPTETFTSHRLPSEWTRLEKFTKDTYIGLLHEMNSNGVRIPRRVLPGDDGGGTAWSAWSVGLVGFGFVQTVFLVSRPEQVWGVYTNKGALPAAGLIS